MLSDAFNLELPATLTYDYELPESVAGDTTKTDPKNKKNASCALLLLRSAAVSLHPSAPS